MNNENDIDEAVKLFEDFTGENPENIEIRKIEIPEIGLEIGTLDGLMYTAIRDGVEEKYIHEFKKNSRPLLAVSYDGKQLIVIGGSYQFTEKGIEDI